MDERERERAKRGGGGGGKREGSWAGKRVIFPLLLKLTQERFHFCRNRSPWTENGRAWE
jgi:hypothetical protein